MFKNYSVNENRTELSYLKKLRQQNNCFKIKHREFHTHYAQIHLHRKKIMREMTSCFYSSNHSKSFF